MTDLVCKVGDRSIASAYVDAPQPYRHGMPWLLSEPLYASRLEELAGDMQLLVLKLWIIPFGFVTQTFSRPNSTIQLLIALAKSGTTPR